MLIRTTAALLALVVAGTILPPTFPSIAVDRPTIDNPNATKLPTQRLRQIQQDIQTRYNIPRQQQQFVAAQARTWNACMGLAAPNTLCAEIAIFGWQVIIKNRNNDRFWIYHIDQSGKRLALNTTASRPKPTQLPAPRFVSNVVPPIGDDVLFQSSLILGEVPTYYALALTADGDRGFLLTRRELRPNAPKPTLLKRIPLAQGQAFLDLLTRNSLDHFNGISYFNNDRAALDAPVFQLNYAGITTEYTAGDESQLPPKLRAIVLAWNKLVP
jgi:hypothetical protein